MSITSAFGGRYLAAWRRWRRGEGRRESFDFLGFTHRWVRNRRDTAFVLRRSTARTRLRAKLKEVGETLRKQCHAPLGRQGLWLGRVVRGYFAYHAVPGNMAALESFRTGVTRAEARASIFEYIEAFYNRVRRHSSLGYVAPAEYERAHNPTHR